MARVTNAPASRSRRKRRLRQARGFFGGRHRLFRTATESVDRALKMSTTHRRQKKREYRALWIIRLVAACDQAGIAYNRFIEGLTKANIRLNRKMLSEIALHDPQGFGSLVAQAKAKLA